MTSADDSGMKEYVRRAINYDHMDLQYTFWQMFYLCVAPSRVYKTTKGLGLRTDADGFFLRAASSRR